MSHVVFTRLMWHYDFAVQRVSSESKILLTAHNSAILNSLNCSWGRLEINNSGKL